jgi:hypothetical protein
MNPVQYAEHRNTTERTVRRWLKDGWLPGATQYPDGRWDIPRDAIEQKPLFPTSTAAPANGYDVPGVSGVMSVARQGDRLSVLDGGQGPTLAEALDRLPALLSVKQAAPLLGLSENEVIDHAEELDAVRWGRRGRGLKIPARVVRDLAGL